MVQSVIHHVTLVSGEHTFHPCKQNPSVYTPHDGVKWRNTSMPYPTKWTRHMAL